MASFASSATTFYIYPDVLYSSLFLLYKFNFLSSLIEIYIIQNILHTKYQISLSCASNINMGVNKVKLL